MQYRDSDIFQSSNRLLFGKMEALIIFIDFKHVLIAEQDIQRTMAQLKNAETSRKFKSKSSFVSFARISTGPL